MSIPQFNHLSEEEKAAVLNAPAVVTYLIAGVDGDFDTNEEEQAKHIVHFRTSTGDPMLYDYFTEVEKTFVAKLNELHRKYGNLQPGPRTAVLSEELARLNSILPKIDRLFGRSLLKSLRSLAKAVSEASGGILGFLDVSYEEMHLAGLEMITVEL
jgi:hypothetical protein